MGIRRPLGAAGVLLVLNFCWCLSVIGLLREEWFKGGLYPKVPQYSPLLPKVPLVPTYPPMNPPPIKDPITWALQQYPFARFLVQGSLIKLANPKKGTPYYNMVTGWDVPPYTKSLLRVLKRDYSSRTIIPIKDC